MLGDKIYIEHIGNEHIPSHETILMKTYVPSIYLSFSLLNLTTL